MDFEDVTAGTPRVLGHCLDLFMAPDEQKVHSSLSRSATPNKFASHPDIQFFSSVKKKHHFAYHSSKRENHVGALSSTASLKNTPDFDPFSRPLLLARLRSYTALNWGLPYFTKGENNLTELFCSAHGWVCEQISLLNPSKNTLRCTGCNRSLTLTFNAIDQQPQSAACFFDMADIIELNSMLRDSYLQQVELTAHEKSCPWRHFACPLDGTYYLTPHIDATNESLISDYLALLHKLYTGFALASHYTHELSALAPPEVMSDLGAFIRISNSWLLSRYFKDSKENFAPLLDKSLPPWAYVLAAMGWSLDVQVFDKSCVPLLVCSMCNQRIFLSTENLENGSGEVSIVQDRVLNLISNDHSNIESPNDLGIESPNDPSIEQKATASSSDAVLDTRKVSLSPDPMDYEHEDSAYACHKPWCFLISKFGDKSYFDYFHDMLINSEENINPEGQYQEKADGFHDTKVAVESREFTDVPHKKRSLDIEADLANFSKLRKLYFSGADS